jgi:hypothetical protein
VSKKKRLREDRERAERERVAKLEAAGCNVVTPRQRAKVERALAEIQRTLSLTAKKAADKIREIATAPIPIEGRRMLLEREKERLRALVAEHFEGKPAHLEYFVSCFEMACGEEPVTKTTGRELLRELMEGIHGTT